MMIFILFLLLAAYITAVICYPHETVIFTVIATMIFSTIFLVGGIINCCDKPCISNIHFNKKVEVDGNELDNIQKQLDIYKEIVEDTRKQLNLIIELRENDRTTIHKLQATVDSLYPLACQIKICDRRSRLTEKQLNKLSENGDNNKKDS